MSKPSKTPAVETDSSAESYAHMSPQPTPPQAPGVTLQGLLAQYGEVCFNLEALTAAKASIQQQIAAFPQVAPAKG